MKPGATHKLETSMRDGGKPDTAPPTRKVSYAIPCSSIFRDAVLALAERRCVNVGDIARSIMLCVPVDVTGKADDPGEPFPNDREDVVLKSGPSAGKPWRRKPRLQVRLPAGYSIVQIRKALGLALAVDRGEHAVSVVTTRGPGASEVAAARREEISRLQAMVSALAFEPLDGGVRSPAQAMHVLGFAPGRKPPLSTVKARFRMLAAIYHPDSGYGDHTRMSQLNQAMALLKTTPPL